MTTVSNRYVGFVDSWRRRRRRSQRPLVVAPAIRPPFRYRGVPLKRHSFRHAGKKGMEYEKINAVPKGYAFLWDQLSGVFD